ncbi:MAG: DNA-3-methyladenine glycosylase I [Chloroflexi bacterium]|nr:DNA-3-methyladenine glycosylase I [Chloroflexota bacterium]MDA1218813.1 DNA-3-methyladenine glycosylase I [Chloroflexota bacterium]PKB57752.1 MAG: DNA-3-methyladenine glycosylase [SAR202 cluster bacterium Casp-Chloro-G3]
MPNRCAWTGSDPLMIEYHDHEWGVPQHDDRVLFEYIILDGAQAGLSWLTILKKREGYRRAFDGFDVGLIAQYDDAKIVQLLQDPAIVRNRLKVNSAVTNARAFIAVQQEFGSFDAYLWSFVGNQTQKNAWPADTEIPAKTPVAEVLSKDLLKRGFKFVGPTICYAFMQAAGMVNDHVVQCFRYDQV